MKRSKFIVVLSIGLASILIVMIAVLSTALSRTWREYCHFKQREYTAHQQLANAHQQAEQKDEYFRRLIDPNDSTFVERIARQRLGYVSPEETILRFE